MAVSYIQNQHFTIANEENFKIFLKDILSHDETERIIKGLLAQIATTETDDPEIRKK